MGVEVPAVVDASVAPLAFADFAAFEARRFCLDAEGAIFAVVRLSDCLEKEQTVADEERTRGRGRRRERAAFESMSESGCTSAECRAHSQISA